MTYIHFIVNPISGKGSNVLEIDYIKSFFPDDNFRIEVYHTKHKGHAIELGRAAVILNADIVVACGGDGTINEVASALVGTGKKLGIVPLGSGNGLASNLGLPLCIDDALEIIRGGASTLMDVGKVNGNYFFSNMGTGIDAAIIRHYQKRGKRTLLAYIISSIAASFSYKATPVLVTLESQTITAKPFMLFISNSNQMGYNMSLTPNAKLNDGRLDIVLIPELSIIGKLALGYMVLRNRTGQFKKAKRFLSDRLRIELPQKIFTDIQLDGEHHYLKTNILEVSLLSDAMQVIVADS